MKAVTYDRYGETDVLDVRDIPVPSPRRGQVLVRVQAAALNPKDVLVRKGKFPLLAGFGFPKRVGYDWSGVVVDPGDALNAPPAGSRVFGMIQAWSGGACAEFVAAHLSELSAIPDALSFEEGAAMPLASLTSLQALRDIAGVGPGTHVTIHGASGGVGLFAIQIAKHLGAHVTTTSSDENRSLCLSLGADEAMDYRTGTFLSPGRRCDAFFDVYGNQTFARVRPLLAADGVYVSTVPKRHVLLASAATWLSRQRCRLVVVRSRSEDLRQIAAWAGAGTLRAVIDSRFALEDIRAAQARVETRRARGKVVIQVGANPHRGQAAAGMLTET
jgi:NADPH:quinone reductase-like Zn-dependent oxidoreductase